MKNNLFGIIIFCFFSLTAFAQDMEVRVTKIWDYAPHNAFTDLIRFNDKFYCAFREATGHVPSETGEDGKIRILISEDGEKWDSFALLSKQDYDLRDSKLSVTPDGRLMVLMGGSNYDGKNLVNRLTHVSFMDRNNKQFTEPEPVIIDKKIRTDYDWLWRVTWYDKTGYGVVYRKKDSTKSEVFLVKTRNGIDYTLIAALNIDSLPGESTVCFTPEGAMLILMRRDGGDKHGLLGSAKPPYTQWDWNNLGIRLGGPDIIPLTINTYIVGSRFFQDDKPKTALFTSGESGPLKLFLVLPSGGDTSYPGMLIYKDILWISYYSSHEGKTAIYLAEIPLSEITIY